MNILTSIDWIKMILYTLLLSWTYEKIPDQTYCSPKRILFAYCVLIVGRFPLYLFPYILPEFWLQSFIRFLPCMIFLRIRKQLSWSSCIYYSLVGWLAFTLCTNFFMIPIIRPYSVSDMVSGNAGGFALIRALIFEFGLNFTVITLLIRLTCRTKSYRLNRSQLLIILAALLCELYLTQTLTSPEPQVAASFPALSAYLVFLQGFVLTVLILFENYSYSLQLQEEQHLAETSIRYRYDAAMAKYDASQNVRQLHHDMKNHLAAIQLLSEDNARLSEYIQTISQELNSYDRIISTGNNLLDGLLTEKIQLATKRGIEMDISLNITLCPFLSDRDICALFGNMADNAIEAASKVEPRNQPFIHLESKLVANSCMITCSNSYSSPLKWEGTVLQTTKKDASYHGIGIPSMRRVVERFHGQLTMDLDTPGVFTLVCLIPLE